MNIILIGYRCCGKNGVGKALAASLNYRFIDCDQLAVERLGMSISACVALNGWPAFRAVEAEVLRAVLQHENQVIATGGGIILNPEMRALLKAQAFVVWLTAGYENIVNRIKADENSRSMRPPLGHYKNLADEVQVTLKERQPLYSECAGLTVNTDLFTVDQTAAEIMQAWHLMPATF